MTGADQKLPIDPDDRRREQQRQRARRHRRRERNNLQQFSIDVPHAFIEFMMAEGYLAEHDAADPHAIERALETYLVDQISQ